MLIVLKGGEKLTNNLCFYKLFRYCVAYETVGANYSIILPVPSLQLVQAAYHLHFYRGSFAPLELAWLYPETPNKMIALYVIPVSALIKVKPM